MSFSFFSFAQSSSGNLDPVIVRGIQTSAQLSDFLNSKSVIERSDIEKMQVGDLYDLLQGEAGLDMSRTGGVGSPISIYSRGSSSSQTLILIDGIPFGGQDATGAASPLQNIPVQLIERIEITRGNSSAQYGPGAMGGVIEITTRSGSNRVPMPYSELGFGSQNTKSILVGYGGKVNNTQFDLSINQNTSNGIEAISATKFPNYVDSYTGNTNGINPSTNPYKTSGLSLSVKQTIDGLTSIDFKLLKTNLSSSFDNYFASPAINWKSKSGSDFARFGLIRQMNDAWISNVSYGYSGTDLSTLKNEVPDRTYGSTTTHHRLFKWTNDWVVDPNMDLTLGYENKTSNLKGLHDSTAYDVDFNSYFIPVVLDKKITNSRVYSGVNYRHERWSSQFNLSHNQISNFSSKTNYFYGLGHQLSSEFKTFANQSTAVLYPTLGQLYDTSYGGNVNLKPENSLSRELGILYKDASNLLRATYFTVDYSNLIGSSSILVDDPFWSSQFITKLTNEKKSSNKGIEFVWRGEAGKFQFGVSITHQNPVNEASTQKVLNKSNNFGSADLSYSLDNKNKLNAKIVVIGGRYTPNLDPINFDPVKVAGYALLKFGWQHQIDTAWSSSLTLENAINKQYYQVYGYNNPLRSVFANLRYTPK